MTPLNPREPGGEINLKAKRRWEILRRTDNYRRDWDTCFTKMVHRLKTFVILGHEDYGCEPDIEKMNEARAELMKDPPAWEDFLTNKFQRDWDEAKLKEEFLYVTEGREIAEKYGLITPYHYGDPLWDPFKDPMIDVFKDMLAVRIITQNPTSYKLSQDRKTMIADHTPHLREERFLTIEIDLYEKQGMIRDLIKSQLDYYQNSLKRPKTKERGRALDFYLYTEKGKVSIYELWDMNKKSKKSPWLITKKLYPFKTNGKSYQPNRNNYNKDVRSTWKQIDEAIKTAHSEINFLM
jgi:hypothetical protein